MHPLGSEEHIQSPLHPVGGRGGWLASSFSAFIRAASETGCRGAFVFLQIQDPCEIHGIVVSAWRELAGVQIYFILAQQAFLGLSVSPCLSLSRPFKETSAFEQLVFKWQKDQAQKASWTSNRSYNTTFWWLKCKRSRNIWIPFPINHTWSLKKIKGECAQHDVFCLLEPKTSEEYLEADESKIFTHPYI